MVRSGRGQLKEVRDLRHGRLEQCAKVELRRQGLVWWTDRREGYTKGIGDEVGWFPARKYGHPNGGLCEAARENDADDEGEDIGWMRR
jgi:hypothetical protein